MIENTFPKVGFPAWREGPGWAVWGFLLIFFNYFFIQDPRRKVLLVLTLVSPQGLPLPVPPRHPAPHPPPPGIFWAVLGLHCCTIFSPPATRGGYLELPCVDFSVQWLLWLQSTGSRTRASAVVAPGLGCSKACGIFPDQGSNLCFLHWQVDSLPLSHQESPPLSVPSWSIYLFGLC